MGASVVSLPRNDVATQPPEGGGLGGGDVFAKFHATFRLCLIPEC